MYMFEYIMYIFSEQMCMFEYPKTPDIMLSIVSSQQLDWTHTFDTHCIFQAILYKTHKAHESITNHLKF